jgi:hypothetical protein
MRHYLAILLPAEGGTWRAFVPDFPEIQVERVGFSRTRKEIAACLERHTEARSGDLPPPRSLREIECDREWLTRSGVDIARAIVTIVTWSGGRVGEGRGHG